MGQHVNLEFLLVLFRTMLNGSVGLIRSMASGRRIQNAPPKGAKHWHVYCIYISIVTRINRIRE
jgi:hypothetical protein